MLGQRSCARRQPLPADVTEPTPEDLIRLARDHEALEPLFGRRETAASASKRRGLLIAHTQLQTNRGALRSTKSDERRGLLQ
jgi:hypothetical protein